MSASTKLPTPSGSVGTWGAELNDFLSQSMVASTTAGASNGLLKKDHAAITDGGKVGIGTSSPSARLEVASAGVGIYSSVLEGTSLMKGTVNGCVFNNGSGEEVYIRGGLSNSAVIINDISTGNTLMNYTGGNVGIGTNAPKSKLHVIGISVYADNAAAIAAGLTNGAFYSNSTGALFVTQ